MPGGRIARVRRRAGLLAAAAVVATTGAVGVAGVAGAAEQADWTVHAKDNRDTNPVTDNCFSTDPEPAEVCEPDEVATLDISTGDTVTWDFGGSDVGHNAASDNDVAADPAWSSWKEPPSGVVTSGRYSREFTQPGDYEFVCQAHPTTMRGTISVTGEATEPPNDPPDDPPADSPTNTPSSPPPDTSGTTPAPTPEDDAVKPTVRKVKLEAKRRAVRVRFRLSEAATVTIKVKRRGSKKVLKAARLQAPVGTRSVMLRSKRLKSGRYTVEIQARDAYGNRSSVARKRLALRG
jgi:plastocyanin